MKHKLKIQHCYYEAVKSGSKTFEIRYNDRNYQKGDRVELTPICKYGVMQEEVVLPFIIGDVCSFQQKEGYVVFSLIEDKEQSK